MSIVFYSHLCQAIIATHLVGQLPRNRRVKLANDTLKHEAQMIFFQETLQFLRILTQTPTDDCLIYM